MLGNVMEYYVMLCCVVLCCVVLCYVTIFMKKMLISSWHVLWADIFLQQFSSVLAQFVNHKGSLSKHLFAVYMQWQNVAYNTGPIYVLFCCIALVTVRPET